MRTGSLIAAIVLFLAAEVPAGAGETELSGHIAGDLRIFLLSPAHEGQSEATLNPSLVLQPELRYEWSNGDDRITAIPFARVDAQDSERTHFDLRELNWLHVGTDWDLHLGIDKVFWGVTESRHLVDIINQSDLVEDLDEENKLGQPMINLGLQRNWGHFNAFVMTGFRERTFPGWDGRLRGGAVVDTDEAVYESSAEEWHMDVALRYAMVLGDWDIGLAYFHGTGREPRLIAKEDASGEIVLVPHYDVIDQGSLDAQATLGAWLWKLESILRSGQGDTFAAYVGGFEYTFYGIFQGNADFGVLGEYLYDDRDKDAPPTSFDDDIFLGMRYTLNDVNDTDFLAGVFIDRESGGGFINVEADTRLSDHWTLEVEARAFADIPEDDPGFGIRDDHHLQIRLARYL